MYFLLYVSATIGSNIVGASVQCGDRRCDINDSISNVVITFQHDPLSEVMNIK